MPQLVTVCCVCKKIKLNNTWVPVEPAPGSTLTHGYCPICYQIEVDKMNEIKEDRDEQA